MKRRSIPLFLLLLLLSGCGSNERTNNNGPQITDYSWQMTIAQSTEAEGQTIAYAPDIEGMPNTAVEITLGCTAANGTLTLMDETKGLTYTGTYKLIETNQETSVYEVVVGDTEGMAVVSMTTYHDENQTPTFIINLRDYTLNFFPETE